jgi:hypothetical protein
MQGLSLLGFFPARATPRTALLLVCDDSRSPANGLGKVNDVKERLDVIMRLVVVYSRNLGMHGSTDSRSVYRSVLP